MPEVVYYLRRGDHIKIGYTTDLARRMKVLRPDELLAVEPGNLSLEMGRHHQFASSQVEHPDGHEWFDPTPDLLVHIERMRSVYGLAVDWPDSTGDFVSGRGDYDRAHRHIAADLRTKLREGRWRAGDRLPTIAEMQETYAHLGTREGKPVAKGTVQRALQQLRDEGLIETRGRSFYASAQKVGEDG